MFPMKSVDLAKTPAAQVALHLYNMKLPANLLQRMKKEASFFKDERALPVALWRSLRI